MGVDHGERATIPRNLEYGGTLMQIVPSDFVMYEKEPSVAFKICQNPFFSAEAPCPGPRWELTTLPKAP